MTRPRHLPDLEPLMTIDPTTAELDLEGIRTDIKAHAAELPVDVVDCVGCHIAVNDVPALIAEIERLRAEREHMELNPTGTAEWLKNRVNELTAELDKARRERDEFAQDNRRVAAQLTAANHRADGLAADLRSLRQGHDAYANENQRLREQVYAQKPVIDAAQAWAEIRDSEGLTLADSRKTDEALYDAIEQYRLMDLALTTARDEKAEVAR